MHPSPDDVRAWFAHPLSGTALQTRVDTLHYDAHWTVRYAPQLPIDALTLQYGPTGERLYLRRYGPVTHALWQTVPAPDA